MTYPYPGDDPAAISSAGWSISAASSQLVAFATAVNAGKAQLGKAWKGDAADRAVADVGKMATATPQLERKLTAAGTALETYRSVLASVRSEVDTLRKQHQNLSEVLAGETYSYAHAGRFGEANDLTPVQISAYRSSVATARASTEKQLAELDHQYQAQVTKATQAAHACQAALKTDSTGPTSYQGSTLVTASLAQTFGLDNLGVAHLEKMRTDARQFENDARAVDDSNLPPEERKKRIRALIAKYGLEVNDPDFATTVATDVGVGYFQQLGHKIGAYEFRWGGQDDYDLEQQWFKLNASLLATATNTTNPVHVDGKWMHDFFYDKTAGEQPSWVMTAADYESVGIRFPKAFLDATGQAVLDWESHATKDVLGHIDPPWSQWGQNRYIGIMAPIGLGVIDDPMDRVMKQYADHPDPTSVLFHDGSDGTPGNLYHLLHRQWGEHGQQDLGLAVDAMSGPGNADKRSAADVANDLILDLAKGKNGEPVDVPGGARDSFGRVVGRYLGSFLDDVGRDPSVKPTDLNTILASGLPGEGSVGRIHVNESDLSGALKFLYGDGNDQEVRKTLATAWTNASGQDLGETISDVQSKVGDRSYDGSLPAVQNQMASQAHILGLLTGSDVNAYAGDAKAQAEAAAHRKEMFETLTGLLPTPKIPGASELTQHIFEQSYDLAKGMAIDSVSGTPITEEQVNQHTDETTGNAHRMVANMTPKLIAQLSDLGLPVVTTYENGVPTGVTATVSADTPNAALFTDPTTHRLLPYEQIAGDSQRYKAYEAWLEQHSFLGGNSSSDLTATVEAAYTTGADAAKS